MQVCEDPLSLSASPSVDSGYLRSVVVRARDVSVTYRVNPEIQSGTLKSMLVRGRERRDTREVHAVRGVSFDVYEGEAVGLIGPNGSGKSSLLRAVAGLLKVASGEVLVRSSPVLLGVGAALEPELSGRRNVLLGGTALGMSKREVRARLDDIIEFAGVRDSIDLPLKTFSSGMAARLRFSIASAVQPDLLLIDEALAVGDEEFRERSRKRIQELIDKAGAVFLVSHSLGHIENICSRALWIEQGAVRADGAVKDVVTAYRESIAAGVSGTRASSHGKGTPATGS
jgi:teichoic acid transport system ATP-binding protein